VAEAGCQGEAGAKGPAGVRINVDNDSLANEKVCSRTYTGDKIAGNGVAGGPQ